MAFLKMLRFSVSNVCMRSFMGCENKVFNSIYKRSKHSGIRNYCIVQLPDANQELGSLQSAYKKSERIQAIQFKKLLQDKGFVDKYRKRMKEIIKDIEIKHDNKNKVKDLTNIIMKAAEEVCGTSQKLLYKCNKCDDVFKGQWPLTKHQSVCTGLRSEDPGKRKCDKCLTDVFIGGFSKHYINCQGIKANQMENKTAKRKCDKCLEDFNESYFVIHYRICNGSKEVKCSKCGELFGLKGINTHMKACTGLKADDPNKRKCDKCLKEFGKFGGSFAKHYRKCKGINETKSAIVNCPDCGKEMFIASLNKHRRFNCRGAEQRSNDEILKESEMLSDILMKDLEDVFRNKDNSWINFTEEEVHQLRSRVTRVVKVTEELPDYNEMSPRGVCPDCGNEMDKGYIKKHQKLYCPERPSKKKNMRSVYK